MTWHLANIVLVLVTQIVEMRLPPNQLPAIGRSFTSCDPGSSFLVVTAYWHELFGLQIT